MTARMTLSIDGGPEIAPKIAEANVVLRLERGEDEDGAVTLGPRAQLGIGAAGDATPLSALLNIHLYVAPGRAFISPDAVVGGVAIHPPDAPSGWMTTVAAGEGLERFGESAIGDIVLERIELEVGPENVDVGGRGGRALVRLRARAETIDRDRQVEARFEGAARLWMRDDLFVNAAIGRSVSAYVGASA